MARINLNEDLELAKKGLLRPTVVAKLLKVAPKTVHAWKNLTVKKIHNVKYLDWQEVYSTKPDDVKLLALPLDGATAWGLWKHGNVTPQVTSNPVKVKAVEHAANLLLKVVGLIDKTKVHEAVLSLPAPQEEIILKLPNEVAKIHESVQSSGPCSNCKHDLTRFHTGAVCFFGEGTVAACSCPKIRKE